MQVRVETYSGYKADERPLRFFLEEREYAVIDVLDKWYGLEATWFKIRASDGNIYILRHADQGWTLTSFKSDGSPS